VSTILTRDYVERDRGKLTPTELGMTVWKLLAKMFGDVFEVEFTAKMEQTLDRVESGKDQWDQVVAAFYGPFKNDLTAAEAAARNPEGLPGRGVRQGVSGVWLEDGQALRAERPLPSRARAIRMQDDDADRGGSRERGGAHAAVPDLREPDADPLGTVREVPRVHPIPDCKGTRPLGLGVPCPECGTGELVERRTKRGKSFFGCGRYPAARSRSGTVR